MNCVAAALTVMLLAATAGAMLSPRVERPVASLLALFAGLAVLALPFFFVALGSNREAEEARIRKAIRGALSDEAPTHPPPQRWKDED